MEPNTNTNEQRQQPSESLSGSVTSWGECVVTHREQLADGAGEDDGSIGPAASTELNQEP